MNRIKEWITDRPYAIAGLVFLGLAIIGVGWFGWWQDELELLLLLYVIAIIGIRLDEISRKIGTLRAAASGLDDNGTVLAKLNEIAHSLKVLNHYLAKLTATQRTDSQTSADRKTPPGKQNE